jgi:uncharacterized protein YlxP (DUF503 family)
VTIGVYSLELHLPTAQSLKDKRHSVKRLKDRLRARLNVAVAESPEHSELWQRASLLVVSVSSSRDALVRLFEAVHREAEATVPGEVIELGSEFLEGVETGSPDWPEGGP